MFPYAYTPYFHQHATNHSPTSTIILQCKNYRKPLLQRHVIRILMLVPIFSIASWASLTSLAVARWIDPLRDVYEAFVLYTFFQLLINFLGGERSLIILMHGRPPVDHLWPLDYVLPKVDISDPHTFLSIKRGILQYAWIKPALAVATLVMKATDTFKEGLIQLDSGYMWTSIVYNISICWSLYDLALFWVCMSTDLQPFRPMPKFLVIKGIIFASWWQGFLLSILVWLGAIPSIGGGYTADNLAAAIQDALICFEMPFFAIAQWYSFSWKDFADVTISDARMPMRFAFRDAFGSRDLIEDAKETWSGNKYDYRNFDATDNVMAHEDSSSRAARMQAGMRYERGGRGKYWIPAPGEDAKQPLLSRFGANSHARTMSPGNGKHPSRSPSHAGTKGYGTHEEPNEPELDDEEERLYEKARSLEFGDWNYPVINTHYASREDRLHADPRMMSASTNRAILQPSKANKQRRKSRIQEIQSNVHQHDDPKNKHRGSSSSGEGSSKTKQATSKLQDTASHLPVVGELVRNASSDSAASHSSQLVDLVVEDREAEAIERVRARKEGGAGWNSVEQKHYVKTYPGEPEQEEVRHGFNPDRPEERVTDASHTLTEPFTLGDSESEDDLKPVGDKPGYDETGHEQPWENRVVGDEDGSGSGGGSGKGKGKERQSPDIPEEKNPWSD